MQPYDMRRFIRVYDGDLDAEICAGMIESFEHSAAQQQPNGRGRHAGLEQSAWTELNISRVANASFLNVFRHKLTHALARYNEDVQLPIPIPDSPQSADLILKRYRRGGNEGFQLHFDSIYGVANRYLVFLWYLNDVSEGGGTVFPDLGVRVEARRGRLLMFPPYWNYQHVGEAPISNDKYIVSTYLLF